MGDTCVFCAAFDKAVLHFLACLQERRGLRHCLGVLRCHCTIRFADPFFEVFEFFTQISDGSDDRVQKVFGLRLYVLWGD